MVTVGAPRTCGVSWANKAWRRPSLSKPGLGLKFPSSRWASGQGQRAPFARTWYPAGDSVPQANLARSRWDSLQLPPSGWTSHGDSLGPATRRVAHVCRCLKINIRELGGPLPHERQKKTTYAKRRGVFPTRTHVYVTHFVFSSSIACLSFCSTGSISSTPSVPLTKPWKYM